MMNPKNAFLKLQKGISWFWFFGFILFWLSLASFKFLKGLSLGVLSLALLGSLLLLPFFQRLRPLLLSLLPFWVMLLALVSYIAFRAYPWLHLPHVLGNRISLFLAIPLLVWGMSLWEKPQSFPWEKILFSASFLVLAARVLQMLTSFCVFLPAFIKMHLGVLNSTQCMIYLLHDRIILSDGAAILMLFQCLLLKRQETTQMRLLLWGGIAFSSIALFLISAFSGLLAVLFLFPFWVLFLGGFRILVRDFKIYFWILFSFLLLLSFFWLFLNYGGKWSEYRIFQNMHFQASSLFFRIIQELHLPVSHDALLKIGLISNDPVMNQCADIKSNALCSPLSQKASELSSTHTRALMWSEAFSQFLSAPFFGHGYGTYQALALSHHKGDDDFIRLVGMHGHPHSQYLLLLASTGLLGFSLYLAVFLMLYYYFSKGEKPLFRHMGYLWNSAFLIFGMLEAIFARSALTNLFIVGTSMLLMLNAQGSFFRPWCGALMGSRVPKPS